MKTPPVRFILLLTLLNVCLFKVDATTADTVYLTPTQVNTLFTTSSKSYPSVHDPSVVFDRKDTYYIFGSHNAIAKTKDLRNWVSVGNSSLFGVQHDAGVVTVTSYNNAFKTNMTKTVKVLKAGVPTDVTFGNFDAAGWHCALDQDGRAWTVAGNMWAPDVIYNVAMGKWCMYLSLNGPKWNSVIILLTSDNIEGPYVYQGPVVYTGFRNATNPKISWKLTDLELVIGTQSTLPTRYNRGDNWGNYWPHAIDPCVFYDQQGQLWMAYGSWSGGIFILKLNPENGLRDYTVTYPITNDASGHPLSDPYFGKQIAGGYYVSGEGAYIRYIGDRYYLFVTYGGLEAAKGYTMRTFSSQHPDGPFVDNFGESAIFNRYLLNYGPSDATTRGNLLVGAFSNWSLQTNGEVAQGHNSAIVDDKGRAFLVYHTRFNTGNEFFQNRVHQLFRSENGWLLSAPMEFNGETVNDDSIAAGCSFKPEALPGTYSMLIHRFRLDHASLATAKPSTVTLTSDGKIQGALTGTWSLKQGTGYLTLTVGGVTFRGVVVPQTIDGSSLKAIGITGASPNGQMLWAYKVLPAYAVAYNAKDMKPGVTANQTVSTHVDLSLPMSYGASYEWVSSQPSVISHTGKYSPADTATKLTLTCRIQAENYAFLKEYPVTAAKADSLPGDYLTGIVAYYDFDTLPLVNHYDERQKGTIRQFLNGTPPVVKTDGLRIGQVLHVTGGRHTNNTGGYCFVPNPLEGRTDLSGVTISLWVKRYDASDLFGTVWGFASGYPYLPTSQERFFLTVNSYIGFTNKTDTFAVNYPKQPVANITANNWRLVTVVVDTSSISLYVNGVKYSILFASTAGNKVADFDYGKVMAMLSNAQFLALGSGNAIAGATADYDDLLVYDRALSAEDVRLLYARERRVTDFTAGKPTGLKTVGNESRRTPYQDNTYYDVMGRKVAYPTKPGLYLYNGEKILIKHQR